MITNVWKHSRDKCKYINHLFSSTTLICIFGNVLYYRTCQEHEYKCPIDTLLTTFYANIIFISITYSKVSIQHLMTNSTLIRNISGIAILLYGCMSTARFACGASWYTTGKESFLFWIRTGLFCSSNTTNKCYAISGLYRVLMKNAKLVSFNYEKHVFKMSLVILTPSIGRSTSNQIYGCFLSMSRLIWRMIHFLRIQP